MSLAVWTMEYMAALAFAPFTESMSTQFFLPTVNGRIARSEAYLNVRISLGTSHSEDFNRQGQLSFLQQPGRSSGTLDHVYHSWNSAGKQSESLSLFQICARGDAKASGQRWQKFSGRYAAMVWRIQIIRTGAFRSGGVWWPSWNRWWIDRAAQNASKESEAEGLIRTEKWT